ncbi:MAG: hypothetical protein DVS81_16005 [Candidatus Accumulibacter meliphilus]|jgi:hypothetical protein|uniref:Uncharacterized protein n=1 Tax=Candidatus Accumulibacter meliphilus TaxID=2211374 RepID=A0A369XHK0_9PROT|nr:MAG: hypothetical protein DVS81_16005 [Candidatus Accumulibacter meliphilus]
MQNHPNHPIPKDAIVIEMVEHLDADDREAFEERAAIIEYDGQLPRAHAECLALLEVLRRDPLAVKGVVVLQAEIDGGTEWLLTTDLAFARAQLADIGAGKSLFSIQWRGHGGAVRRRRSPGYAWLRRANLTILYG